MSSKEPSEKPLTLKLADAERFIRSFASKHGRMPYYSEVQKGLKLNWKSAAQKRINTLLAKGVLKKTQTGFTLPELDHDNLVPLLGSVAAGQPIEAISSPDYIDVPKSLLKRGVEHFCLKVRGDSMIEDHILDGDIVLIRKQENCENGDTVVALVDNHATLKKFYRRKNEIELRPSNSKLQSIFLNPQERDIRIAGIYAGLIRQNN